MRGRVTLYTLTGCPHCLHAKQTIKNAGLPMIEVSVEGKLKIQNFLREHTQKSSLPQIFFNNTHIGGNSELQSIKENSLKWNELMKDLTENEMTGFLMIEEDGINGSESSFVCEKDSAGQDITDFLNAGIAKPFRPTWFGSQYSHCFSGKDFVNWYTNIREVDESSAIEAGTEFIQRKYIFSFKKNVEIMTVDSEIAYCLNDGSCSTSLNAGTPNFCKLSSGSSLSSHLRHLTLQMYSKFLSEDGKKVDYKAMKGSKEFEAYVDLSKELQLVSLNEMDENERKSFFINIYNAMVIHTTVVKGPAKGLIGRFLFYSFNKYCIGGHEFSLDDVENGVLRGNKKGAIAFFSPFSSNDPRRRFSLSKVDPRVHFALNCGANSCPPIKTFSGKDIDNELQAATEAYLEGDDALMIDNTGKHPVVYLSSLIKWYMSDFGSSQREAVTWIAENVVEPGKKSCLIEAMRNPRMQVKYISYDWSSNST